ncbi:unnamed protein product [Ranitomeya imitator]|uniref:Uncharacterized protein n=1 Tax=Ranitomeya imitator TaxID=111125 RepID=A0ABN9M8L3_9NEOB|nr:unnamed protein product [Ranitomeya imitator]
MFTAKRTFGDSSFRHRSDCAHYRPPPSPPPLLQISQRFCLRHRGFLHTVSADDGDDRDESA